MKPFQRIEIDPNVCLGKPVIKGTRITASVLLKMLALGKTIDEVCTAYPELTREDVLEVIEYASWLADESSIDPYSNPLPRTGEGIA